MNICCITGRIVREVVREQSHTGQGCVRNAVAAVRDYKERNGTYTSDFINFTAWGMTADYIARNGHKGDLIDIVGSWRTDSTKDGKVIQYLYVKDATIKKSHKNIYAPDQEGQTKEKEEKEDFEDLPF